MACYHFSLRKISRSRGSVTHAIAYISASQLTDIYDGKTYDHRAKQYVDDTVIILPDNAPEEWQDLKTVTDAINASSNQPQAILAREIEFALPKEVNPKKQKALAEDYIRKTYVEDGMVAIVSFHSPLKDPSDEVSYNPHAHVILSAKPLDQEGHWISKTTKKYVCENSAGDTKLLTGAELKNENDYEKIYHYRDANGTESWHTKTYASSHPDECAELINRYPKASQVPHPLIEKWSDPVTLDNWRSEWARMQNEAYEELGLDVRISHLSYERRGLDLVPTIHEGKDITALERQYQAEYDQAIANGEDAVLRHTEIRELNNAIREHNNEVRILYEMKQLREQMRMIVEPVKARIDNMGQSIAEALERLRAEIISLGIRILEAITLRNEAYELARSNREYIRDLSPVKSSTLKELHHERERIQSQLDNTPSIFSGNKREDLHEQLEILDNRINVLTENRKLAAKAKNELMIFQSEFEQADAQIEEMETQRRELTEEYKSKESDIAPEEKDSVHKERIAIRPMIEKEIINRDKLIDFHEEAEAVDRLLTSTISKGNPEYDMQISKHDRQVSISLL